MKPIIDGKAIEQDLPTCERVLRAEPPVEDIYPRDERRKIEYLKACLYAHRMLNRNEDVSCTIENAHLSNLAVFCSEKIETPCIHRYVRPNARYELYLTATPYSLVPGLIYCIYAPYGVLACLHGLGYYRLKSRFFVARCTPDERKRIISDLLHELSAENPIDMGMGVMLRHMPVWRPHGLNFREIHTIVEDRVAPCFDSIGGEFLHFTHKDLLNMRQTVCDHYHTLQMLGEPCWNEHVPF